MFRNNRHPVPQGGHSNGRRSPRLTPVPLQFEFPQVICIINKLKWRGFNHRTAMQPQGRAGGAGPSPPGPPLGPQAGNGPHRCIVMKQHGFYKIWKFQTCLSVSPLLPRPGATGRGRSGSEVRGCCPGAAGRGRSGLEVRGCFPCTRLRSSPTHSFSNRDLLLRASICAKQSNACTDAPLMRPPVPGWPSLVPPGLPSCDSCPLPPPQAWVPASPLSATASLDAPSPFPAQDLCTSQECWCVPCSPHRILS